jgi:hypothetical protein
MQIRDRHPTIDGVLEAWHERLGDSALAYRNHVYRVFNLTLAFALESEEREDLIAVASVFHDLGIWTHGTLDYLPPSAKLAGDHLAEDERRSWVRPVQLMIVNHHKLLPYRGEAEPLVESFRKADACDLSKGLFRFGLDEELVRALNRQFPDEGFRFHVTRLVLGWARSHPTHPFPMVRV